MLKLSLRDGEKVVINGAVLRSAGRSEVLVMNEAAILRGRDIMTPETADTPAKRLYFACMMAYLEPRNLEDHQQSILTLLGELLGALESAEAKALCLSFAHHVAQLDFYRALGDCRQLIAYEEEAFARAEQLSAA